MTQPQAIELLTQMIELRKQNEELAKKVADYEDQKAEVEQAFLNITEYIVTATNSVEIHSALLDFAGVFYSSMYNKTIAYMDISCDKKPYYYAVKFVEGKIIDARKRPRKNRKAIACQEAGAPPMPVAC